MTAFGKRFRLFLFLALDVALILAVVGFVQARTDSPNQVVDRYLSVYSEADMDGLLRLYSPEATFIDVSQRHEVSGTENLRAQFDDLAHKHQSMKVVEKRRAAKGNLVTIEVVYSGVLDCAALGLPVGEVVEYEIPAVLLFEIEDGRIQHQTDYLDFRTIAELQQSLSAVASAAK